MDTLSEVDRSVDDHVRAAEELLESSEMDEEDVTMIRSGAWALNQLLGALVHVQLARLAYDREVDDSV